MGAAPTVWWVTTGEAGFRSQARGLAQAIVADPIEKVVGLKAPWSLMPPALWPLILHGLDKATDRLAPPWPDLVISCSRRAAKVALAVKRASGGRAVAVHIQNPLAALDQFDLVIAMRHDGVEGANVMPVDTALHDVTPAMLATAAEAWRARLSTLPRPLTGVLLGGATKRRDFSADQARVLAERLAGLKAATGGGLLITPSRRTPQAVKAVLRQAFAGDAAVFLWDEAGDNPYRGILALSDQLVVTGDSVSMVSEAIATGRPVQVFDTGGGKRHAEFLANLVERGLVERFDGAPAASEPTAAPASAPVNATPAAAEAVQALLYARTGVSG